MLSLPRGPPVAPRMTVTQPHRRFRPSRISAVANDPGLAPCAGPLADACRFFAELQLGEVTGALTHRTQGPKSIARNKGRRSLGIT